MDNNVALMIIDVQVGMFPESDPVHNAHNLIENIKILIEKARLVGIPIIYVQHNARPGKPLESRTPGWEIHPAVRPNVEDVIIQKKTPDSFHETDLQSELSASVSLRVIEKISSKNSTILQRKFNPALLRLNGGVGFFCISWK